jgi:hypothetical protein
VTPLTDELAIANAFDKLKGRLAKGTTRLRRTIGFPGGQVPDATIFWHPADAIWVHLDAKRVENRYWCCYGVQNPSVGRSLDIAVEINPPQRGFNRRIAGTFVREVGGRVFLAHSGRVGGGKKGVGKRTFVDFHPGLAWATVAWPDGKQSEVILVAGLSDPHFPQQVATFVHEVAKFKAAVLVDAVPKKVKGAATGFIPEFEGRRKVFRLDRIIEASCDHGTVVRWLKHELEVRGLVPSNDRQRDLFILGSNGRMRFLFEIKTSLAPPDIHGGVGQLMLHSAAQTKRPERVLVLPRGLNQHVRSLLAQLQISVLEYRWHDERPRFGRFPLKLPRLVGASMDSNMSD